MDPLGLSQGDIIRSVPVALSVAPPTQLKLNTIRGGIRAWIETPFVPSFGIEEQVHLLFRGSYCPVVVISHSCELDKDRSRARVLVAPMRLLEKLESPAQEEVLLQQRRSLMPLPDVPGLGTYYADLRLLSAVPRDLIADDQRVASMSDDGRRRLQSQIAMFFLRLAQGAIDEFLADSRG